jgi:hypothetical protein
MNSTSDKTLIPKLDVIFARHGIPHTFKSDNGPPFNGNEFKTYLTKLGVTHETSTPECPQGNSVAEAFMKPLGKAIRTARAENRNWVQELSRFLFFILSYRTTPHSSTNIPPAQLLFNRSVRRTLPMLNPKAKVLIDIKKLKQTMKKQKQKKELIMQRVGKGGVGVWITFHNEKKAVSRFTCLKKAISRKTRF